MTDLNQFLKQRLEAYLLRTGRHHYDVADAIGMPRRDMSMFLLGTRDPSIAVAAAINTVIEAP